MKRVNHYHYGILHLIMVLFLGITRLPSNEMHLELHRGLL